MKANIVKTWWIIVKQVFAVVVTCSDALFKSAQGKLTTEYVDHSIRRFSRKILNLIETEVTIRGKRHLKLEPGKRYIYMCNHISLYDIPIFYHAIPGTIRMVAKKELFKIPLFGQAMIAAGIPKIDRQNREQAIEDLKIAREKMENGMTIAMFPEGTRSRTGKMGRLKKGGFVLALESEAIIIPVGIRGSREILPAKTFQLELGRNVEIHIGEPIDTRDYSLDNKQALLEKVQAAMLKLSGQELAE